MMSRQDFTRYPIVVSLYEIHTTQGALLPGGVSCYVCVRPTKLIPEAAADNLRKSYQRSTIVATTMTIL